jgi:hypothetical protein
MEDDLRDLMMSALDDSRFSCHDWMGESGYTQEQQLTVLRLSSEMNRAALNYMKKHPVNKWSAGDWKRYELSQWDCTAQMRTRHCRLDASRRSKRTPWRKHIDVRAAVAIFLDRRSRSSW